jgi:Mlc titration factor MtfA (ptsG expression regulator)
MQANAFFHTWDAFLNNFQLYYRNLDDAGKIRFVKRVESISKNVQIIGKEGLEISNDIKILVISNLVQLTFGLKNYWLFGYEYLYLYPDSFFIKTEQEPVAGSTFQSKIIALSWKDFAHDHLHAKDGKNISLSQFAIALVRTVFNGKKYDYKFASYLDEWFAIIKKECLYKQGGSMAQQVLADQDELPEVFARCTELFFEKPALFKKELPNSYAHLCCLLNQNPLNITENYSFHKSDFISNKLVVPLPSEILINYKYKQWHWAYNLPLFGITVCPMAYVLIHSNQLIHTHQVLSIVLLLGLICGVIFYQYFKNLHLFKHWYSILMVSVLGFSPIVITSLLLINQLYAYPFTSTISSHKIASYYQAEPNNGRINSQAITFNFSDDFLMEYPKARTFKQFNKFPTHPLTIFNEVRYEIRRGLIGIPILYNRETY